ncbi:glycosyltransferase family 4 protein [Parabacteroides timonensis]|uniref:glycosyltransferase family 4 protein n=1 Tax=Parabacteroides timonensis TaxID=1871013 RepID=UPI0009E5F70E|nr:glycosyltransferase family 4 protein [Parabacteroides timonensis]
MNKISENTTNRTIKIVYCIPDLFRPGGIERIISMKTNYLAEYNNGNSYDITIITTGQGKRPAYYEFSNKIKFIDLDINYDEIVSYSFLKRTLIRREKKKKHKTRLEKVLKDISADIVISTFTHDATFLPSIKDGSKKILEFHFSKGYKLQRSITENWSFIFRLAYGLRSFWEEYTIPKKYDAFVVLTKEDKAAWDVIRPDTIAIPNIIPLLSTDVSSKNNKIVIAVGRLDNQKGFDRLIDLWDLVKKDNPDWSLRIFGTGEDKEKLELQIQNKGLQNQIKIFPPEKNIAQRYLESSIFVMTSRFEGFPMVLLEAMSFGLPSVSYSFKCGPKDAIKDGINGFLVEEGDKVAFAEKINILMKDQALRKQMGNKAHEATQKYTYKIIMQKWIDLFQNVLIGK